MRQSSRLLIDLKTLLSQRAVHSQQEIAAALKELGWDVNQSKISRAIHKIGAVRVRNEQGEITYQLPKQASPVAPQNFSHLILNVGHNETLIVIDTTPGSASLIAHSLDHQKKALQILGTIAGDDTIIIIPSSVKNIIHTLNSVKKFLI